MKSGFVVIHRGAAYTGFFKTRQAAAVFKLPSIHHSAPRTALLAVLAFAVQAPIALAQGNASVRGIAATCAQCHGTDGRAAASSVIPGLAGVPRETLIAQMKAFKDGTRPATVMHQLAKGYSEQQVQDIAAYFAAQPRP